jgi:hypothetical protein
MSHCFAANSDFARIEASATKQYVHEFRTAGSCHSCNPEDFSFPKDERDIFCAVPRNASGFENDFPDRHPFPAIECGGVAANHVFDQRILRQAVYSVGADFASVPQYGDPVCDFEDLFQVMRRRPCGVGLTAGKAGTLYLLRGKRRSRGRAHLIAVFCNPKRASSFARDGSRVRFNHA